MFFASAAFASVSMFLLLCFGFLFFLFFLFSLPLYDQGEKLPEWSAPAGGLLNKFSFLRE
jgi:hypothetical protein